MKISRFIIFIIGGIFVSFVSQAHADQMIDLCKIINKAERSFEEINQQRLAVDKNERDPVKLVVFASRSNEISEKLKDSINEYWYINNFQINNFKGVIKKVHPDCPSNRQCIGLKIKLPCARCIFEFYFEDNNHEWAAPLSKWKSALENLNDEDSVTFSGLIVNYESGIMSAVMTELKKKDGITYKVPASQEVKKVIKSENDKIIAMRHKDKSHVSTLNTDCKNARTASCAYEVDRPSATNITLSQLIMAGYVPHVGVTTIVNNLSCESGTITCSGPKEWRVSPAVITLTNDVMTLTPATNLP